MEIIGYFNVKLLSGEIQKKNVYKDQDENTFIKGATGAYIKVSEKKYNNEEYNYQQV